MDPVTAFRLPVACPLQCILVSDLTSASQILTTFRSELKLCSWGSSGLRYIDQQLTHQDSQTCSNSGPKIVQITSTVCPEQFSGTDDNIKLRFRAGHLNGEMDDCETMWLDACNVNPK